MKILGLYPYMHLSSSALLIDGKIVAASAEERFNREKMSTKFPILSAEWCLKQAGISWDDLDLIAVPWNPAKNINYSTKRWVNEMKWRGELLTHVPTQLMRAINSDPAEDMKMSFGNTKIVFLNHHECHAANGFYMSPFSEADILTIDGHGEEESCLTGYADGKGIRQTGSVRYPHSIGLFYGSFTDFLGFRPDQDEWKVMALSAYHKGTSEFEDRVRSLITLTDDGFETDLTYFDYYTFDRRKHFFTQKFIKEFGQPRAKDEPITERHYSIAYAMQKVFEEAVIHMLNVTKKRGSGSGNIILSGGAAMNSVFNGKLDKLDVYKDSFISSCPDDSGVSVGAALLAYHREGSAVRKPEVIKNNDWGPAYSDESIEETLIKFKIPYTKSQNAPKEAAQMLSEGKLIGWVQGPMEFGHRALGRRSILADPRKESTKDLVNAAVKYRESFRPFAPAVIEEEAEKYFELRPGRKVYFMERVIPIKPQWQDQLGAVSHVDGSGRVQTVTKEANPEFHDLISEFGKQTGIPVVLNTSFNLNGEPIVCTPEQAIRTFFSCGLDALVMGSFVIRKSLDVSTQSVSSKDAVQEAV